jgi:hypothetical protein
MKGMGDIPNPKHDKGIKMYMPIYPHKRPRKMPTEPIIAKTKNPRTVATVIICRLFPKDSILIKVIKLYFDKTVRIIKTPMSFSNMCNLKDIGVTSQILGKPGALPVFYEVLCDSGGKCVYAGNHPRHSAPLSNT